MGKRSAVLELFLGDMGSIQRELRPSTQREDQLTMETKLEQIAVKAVNQLPKSVVREIRTPRSVGAGGGRPPPATRWARRNPRPYRDHRYRFCTCAKFNNLVSGYEFDVVGFMRFGCAKLVGAGCHSRTAHGKTK